MRIRRKEKMIKEAIGKLVEGQDLTFEEAK